MRAVALPETVVATLVFILLLLLLRPQAVIARPAPTSTSAMPPSSRSSPARPAQPPLASSTRQPEASATVDVDWQLPSHISPLLGAVMGGCVGAGVIALLSIRIRQLKRAPDAPTLPQDARQRAPAETDSDSEISEEADALLAATAARRQRERARARALARARDQARLQDDATQAAQRRERADWAQPLPPPLPLAPAPPAWHRAGERFSRTSSSGLGSSLSDTPLVDRVRNVFRSTPTVGSLVEL